MDEKKKKLSDLEMPAGAVGYTDPDTGEVSDHEPGLQEGDLVMDYVMPLKSLFTGGLAAAGRMAINKMGQQGVKSIKDRMPPPGAEKAGTLDYSMMKGSGAQGPGNSGMTAKYSQGGAGGQTGAGKMTDATAGFKSRPGLKVLDEEDLSFKH